MSLEKQFADTVLQLAADRSRSCARRDRFETRRLTKQSFDLRVSLRSWQGRRYGPKLEHVPCVSNNHSRHYRSTERKAYLFAIRREMRLSRGSGRVSMRRFLIILAFALYSPSICASVLPPPRPQDLQYFSSEPPEAILEDIGLETIEHPLPPRRIEATPSPLNGFEPVDTSARSRIEDSLLEDAIIMAGPNDPALDLFEAQVHMLELERAAFWDQRSLAQPEENGNRAERSECSFLCIRQGSFLDRVLR